MSKILPQQQRFKIFLSSPTGNEVDITDSVKETVSLEIDNMMLSRLNFTLRKPDYYTEYLRIGYKIKFYGGYIDRLNFKDSLAQSPYFKFMFDGSIISIKLDYMEDGDSDVKIEAIDGTWNKSGYSTNKFRYPSKECPRTWADTNKIRVSDIVTNIVEKEFGNIRLNMSLGQDTDIEYTLTDPIVQDNISDWAFLRHLAKRCSCYIWTSVEGNDIVVNFIDRSKAIGEPGRKEFVWIGRAGRNFVDGAYLNKSNNYGDADNSKLKANQILLTSVSLEESPSLYGAHITKITDFDDETGEYMEKLVSYDETKDEIIYYELDQEKINEMERTEEGRKETNRLLKMGAFNIPWEEAKPYYKEVRMPKGILDALDKPMLGLTVTASCDGDVNIQPHQSYMIHGISRYSSMQNKSRKYWLKSMTHSWGADGFTTEMEFMA